MLKHLKKMTQVYERYMTYKGRRVALDILLRADDRTLADNGFSRELLELGIKGWPWRTIPEQEPRFLLGNAPTATQKAIAELNSYSDAELHDLGISRGGISEAVRNGRTDIELPMHRQVA